MIFLTVGCFRYEQEINRRNDAETEFVMLKKVWNAAEWAVKLKAVQTRTKKIYCSDNCSVFCRTWMRATCQKWNLKTWCLL